MMYHHQDLWSASDWTKQVFSQSEVPESSVWNFYRETNGDIVKCQLFSQAKVGIARRGDSHMKGVGMLVVLLRGVNFGFWSHLRCSGQNAVIFSSKGLFYGCTRTNIKDYIFSICFIYSIHVINT